LRPFKLGALFAILFFSVFTAVPASAHSELETATPGPDEILTIWPSEVNLTFNENLLTADQQQINFVSVINSSGKQIDNQDSKVVGNIVSITLPDQQPNGSYFVNYRVVSADGHVIEDSYEFLFDGEITAGEPVAISATDEETESVPISAEVESETSPWSALIVLASVISFGVLIYQMRKNRIR
jgi:methionine-rich copper-binding protein CopC